LHFDDKRFAAVQTWEVHSYRPAGKQPADRQRFEASLTIPFLLCIDRDAILGWQVVKRGK
jgi:hypothetical protein